MRRARQLHLHARILEEPSRSLAGHLTDRRLHRVLAGASFSTSSTGRPEVTLTIMLFHHLVAAKLNVLSGADDYIMDAITPATISCATYGSPQQADRRPEGRMRGDQGRARRLQRDPVCRGCTKIDVMLSIDGPAALDNAAAHRGKLVGFDQEEAQLGRPDPEESERKKERSTRRSFLFSCRNSASRDHPARLQAAAKMIFKTTIPRNIHCPYLV